MVIEKILVGKRIILRQIELDDCTNVYVKWLNDPNINRYLETRWSKQNLDSIKEFVKSQRENNHSILLAITMLEDGKHIGNIKIGPVNSYHLHADISYFIGENAYWNKGLASEAINMICQFGFEELGLHRVEAGCYSAAIGSWKALEKNGFVKEGIFRERVISDGEYMDIYRYGLLKKEFVADV